MATTSSRGRGGSAVVVALVLLAGAAAVSAGPAGAATTSVSLFDDDGERALFPAGEQLAPGQPRTACISVGAASAVPGDDVRMAATAVSGSLAARLSITVEMGSGASMGNCSGFSGTTVWTGTLAALAAAATGDGIPTGWQPSTVGNRSFRITAELPDDQATAGQVATGRFEWRLVPSAVTPPESPSPTSPSPRPTRPIPPRTTPDEPTGQGPTGPSEPGPTGTPAPEPTATAPSAGPGGQQTGDPVDDPDPGALPEPDPTAPRGADPGLDPGPGPGADPGAGPPGPGTAAGGGAAPDVVLGVPVTSLRETAERASAVAMTVVRSPQYPLSALALAAIFLLVQDLIDRRDPKLAAARLTNRDDRQAFPDLFPPSGRPLTEGVR